jgi:hypothetical protein
LHDSLAFYEDATPSLGLGLGAIWVMSISNVTARTPPAIKTLTRGTLLVENKKILSTGLPTGAKVETVIDFSQP